MILAGLLSLVNFIINLIPFNLPGFPDTFASTINLVHEYLQGAISFIYAYVIDYNVVKTVFSIIIVWIGAKYSYRFLMWVIRKIPMLNIKD